MNPKILRFTALALLLVASSVHAQDARPERGGRQKAFGRPGPVAPLQFSVEGLTPDNSAAVGASLTALTYDAFGCSACGVRQSAAGNCPKCKAPLKAEKAPLFADARAADSAVTLTLAGPARLSQIEAALSAHSVRVDPARFPLTGRLQLHLKGAEDAVATTQKDLEGSKLFVNVVAAYDEKGGEIRCAARAGDGATLAALRDVLAKGSTSLADISWIAPKVRRGKDAAGGRGKGRADEDGDDDDEGDEDAHDHGGHGDHDGHDHDDR